MPRIGFVFYWDFVMRGWKVGSFFQMSTNIFFGKFVVAHTSDQNPDLISAFTSKFHYIVIKLNNVTIPFPCCLST